MFGGQLKSPVRQLLQDIGDMVGVGLVAREVEPNDCLSRVRIKDVDGVPVRKSKHGVGAFVLHVLHGGGLASFALIGPDPNDATMYNWAVDKVVQLLLPRHPQYNAGLLFQIGLLR